MEENKLNNDELKQVAGGTGGGELNEPAHIIQTTAYYEDKHMNRERGIFEAGTNVYMLNFQVGSRGEVYLIKSINGHRRGFVPEETLRRGWDD